MKRLFLSALLLVSFTNALGRPLPFTTPSPPLRAASPAGSLSQDDTVYFGGTRWAPDSMRWEAMRDSVWTFDTGVGSFLKQAGHAYPGVNPYKADGLHGGMEGWLGIDNTYGGNTTYLTPSWFRRLAASDSRWKGLPCVGAGAGLQGQYSFWAGAFPAEAESLCYTAGTGYGNSWNICIQHSFAYAGGAVTLRYQYKNDTEDGFDYTYVYVDTSGEGDNVEVTSYTSTKSGTESRALTPGIELPFVPKPITIRFCVVSDGTYSDQDGMSPTACGAFAVDNITLRGAITHTADFETSDNGWTLSTLAPGLGGEWSNLAYLGDLPPLSEPLASTCAIRDSVLVFYDSTGTHSRFQDNVAISPWIDLERYGIEGRDAYFVDLNGFFFLPLHDYMFVQVNAQWFPDTCSVTGKERISNWTSSGFAYYFGSVPTCNPPGQGTHINFTNVIPPGVQEVRIAVGVVDYCRFFFNCSGESNTTPWFDNLRFATHNIATIQRAIDQAASGDTVWVSPGTYTGAGNVNLTFRGKNIVLKSVAGSETTIIDGSRKHRGLVCDQGEDSTAAVIGFTFTNCMAPYDSLGQQLDGGAIYLGSGVSVRLEACVFKDSKARQGGGLFAALDARPKVTNCWFLGNTSWGAFVGNAGFEDCRFDGNVGGAYTQHDVSSTFIRCSFEANQGTGAVLDGYPRVDECAFKNNTGDGLNLYYRGSVQKSTFTGNHGVGLGFGYSLLPGCGSQVTVINCSFSENRNGGIYGCGGSVDSCLVENNQGRGVWSGSTRLSHCRIQNNVTAVDGGGVFLDGGVLEDCIISGNAAVRGGGIAAIADNYPNSNQLFRVRDCVISGNRAKRGGGLFVAHQFPGLPSTPPSVERTTVSSNRADWGGGMYVGETPLSVSRSIIWGNKADSSGADVFLSDPDSVTTFTCSALDSFGVAGNGQAVYNGPQVFSDPFFCGPGRPEDAPTTAGNYTVAFDSPCLPGKSPCDSLIGALGQGCDVVSVVPGPEPEEPPLLKSPGIRVGPNPFVGALTIDYLASIGAVPKLDIFSVDGRRVASFQPQSKSGSVIWDGRDASGRRVSPGIYFIRFTAGDLRVVRRVVRITG